MANAIKLSRTATTVDTPIPRRSVTFIPSQVGGADQTPISYTSTPLKLLWYDMKLSLTKITATFGIIRPLRFGADASPWDELYPNVQNITSMVLHTILIFAQSVFLISLPFFVFTPVFAFVAYVVGFIIFNTVTCTLLNGSKLKVYPSVEVDREGKFSHEYWIFLNGVSVGRDWLQSNIDRLSLTFGRPVTGVHNPTDGILFDLIQCLVQRNFAYSTQDVREAYGCIKEALLDPKIKKVVFIIHSQGGIEGGLILDWLFAEVSRHALHRLEVYSFGNAANHFNNPDYHSTDAAPEEGEVVPDKAHRDKVIRHIEHYANAGDFVAQFGVLNYTRINNRFMGRLFLSPHSGHLLNQHYLHQMFPLGSDHRALDNNAFMDMEVRLNRHDVEGREDLTGCLVEASEGECTFVGDVNSNISPLVLFEEKERPRRLRVRDFSRLWLYRNGGSPPAD